MSIIASKKFLDDFESECDRLATMHLFWNDNDKIPGFVDNFLAWCLGELRKRAYDEDLIESLMHRLEIAIAGNTRWGSGGDDLAKDLFSGLNDE